MLSDIQIAQNAKMRNIYEVAAELGIDENLVVPYGKNKAKIELSALKNVKKSGKLILVTAITPTPAGEGKTTTTIGLADGLRRLGKKVCVALREPSLGSVFGVKGGAAGGGYAQVVPMEDINLHFTGDFHAIGAANNLLAAMLDNHIQQGNALNADVRSITWKRCVDMNDRQLRYIVDGLGGKKNGVPREDGFEITVASEVMATLCLSGSIKELKQRLSEITVAESADGKPITAGDLKAAGSMCALLKDALMPNLVQTLEGTPSLVHGGPFANIAHGCNSVIATKLALGYADYAVTEAGFGADLGAEKFFDIKCRKAELTPDAAVVVATIRALKMHGGKKKDELKNEDAEAVKLGIPNLLRHVKNVTDVYKVPCVVAINRFPTDTDAEIEEVKSACEEKGIKAVLSDVWAKGGEGGEELAKEVTRLCEEKNGEFTFAYDDEDGIKQKIEKLVKKVYGGAGAVYTDEAETAIKKITERGLWKNPVCVAKTQYSFSDDPTKLCAPQGFTVTVRGVKACTGAGFNVVYTGDILTMPGLPVRPAAENIDVTSDGKIIGLF